ncbi:MAG TPA: DUF1015 domain-containing protein [Elusimicrobiota bacterium]|nr:DUF1015 domain-containing protein [Elusimicrobiota bacterium]
MAEIRPFRAFHHHPSVRRELRRLVCPPYDIISSDDQKRLLRKHPENFVRIELPSGRPPGKYRRAAALWRRWVERGFIIRDFSPAFYAYETEFVSRLARRRLRRRGFFAALRLRPWGQGVHPHEKTLSTPKADRFKLFKSMRLQTSPIQCLFWDRSRLATRLLARVARGGAWREFSDTEARHRFWRMGDAKTIRQLQKVLAASDVVIADGHHRYETSRAYGAWCRSRGQATESSRYVMAYFSPTSDAGLEILPTHRAVGADKAHFVNLDQWGKMEPVRDYAHLQRRLRSSRAAAVGVYREGKYYFYRFTAVPASLRRTPFENSSVALLHTGPLAGLGREDFFFSRRAEEALRWARRSRGWGFILTPSTVEEVMRVALFGLVMPPKSTYFYPKIPSGILGRSLSGPL